MSSYRDYLYLFFYITIILCSVILLIASIFSSDILKSILSIVVFVCIVGIIVLNKSGKSDSPPAPPTKHEETKPHENKPEETKK